MKRIVTTSIFACLAFAASAQTVKLGIEARADYVQELRNDAVDHEESGFKGKQLRLRMDGDLGGGFSYVLRQKLNKMHSVSSLFDATDWIALTYTRNNWSFIGGKQMMDVGGYEYYVSSIDHYFYSVFFSQIACYQMGAAAAYTFDDNRHTIRFQLTESPFRKNDNPLNKEMYAYNLIWNGSFDCGYNTKWSVNMMEYRPGKFINYIALGNQLKASRFYVNYDLMTRALSAKELFFKDFSMMLKLVYSHTPKLNIFAKATYDYNDSERLGDFCVAPGTEILRLGGGAEFFPLKSSKDVRLHFYYNCTTGHYGELDGEQHTPYHTFALGVTWRLNIL